MIQNEYITQEDSITLTLKPLLIYNPIADHGNAEKILPTVKELFSRHQFDFDLMLTERPGHALEIAKEQAEAGRSLIIGAGGDGTMNEVINGLMRAETLDQRKPVMAVLPVGRGNDFAFGIDITKDVEKAVQAIVNGITKRIDVGLVTGGDYPQGRYFGNGVGLGFDTVVGFEAVKVKWAHGIASYLVGLIRTIFIYSKTPTYEIILDDETITQPSLMVSIMNGKRMGGSFHMAPQGDPGDGLFNLCIASQVPQMKILPLAMKFMSGSQAGHPAIRMPQSRTVVVKAITGSIPAHADGETICYSGSELSIELIPQALDVISMDGV
jgi:YegS/Rv2252/BmrU family lipid kinase